MDDRPARVSRPARRRAAARGLGLGAALIASAMGPPAVSQSPAAPEPPRGNADESKVGPYVLPDPLRMAAGGTVTNAAAWNDGQRAKVLELFVQNQFGRTPAASIALASEVWEKDAPAFDGLARRTQARLTFPGRSEGPTLRVVLYTPAKATGPSPVLLHLGFSPNVLVFDDPAIEEGFGWNPRDKVRVPGRQAPRLAGFDARPFLERGLAVAHIYYGDIEPDFDGGAVHGVRAMFGPVEPRGQDAWGAIGAWSWGLSRVADFLASQESVDPQRIALSGASRLGKATLWAAAQDTRFALVMPLISGEGGAALSRRQFGETIAAITAPGKFSYWFAPRYGTYAQRVQELPVDSHMLLALIAPRPMLLVTGQDDTWSDPRGEFLAARAATPVYRLLGKTGVEAEAAKVGELTGGDLAYFMHDGGHTVLPGDLVVMADFMARKLAPPP